MEDQFDLGCLVNRLTIKPGRLELIFQYRIEGGIFEDRRSADKTRVGYLPIFPDFHLNHHRAGYMTGLGDGRINRRRLPGELKRFKLRLLDCRS